MGKSSGRKKKSGGSGSASASVPASASASSSSVSAENAVKTGAAGVAEAELNAAVFLRRAQALKEEGNQLFQAREFAGALEAYQQALKLVPRGHPDRAVFHSNRAACLMQMRPVQHEAVAAECTLALEVQPRFARALFRRARAQEALGRPEAALRDILLLLEAEPAHTDGLEMARRLQAVLEPSSNRRTAATTSAATSSSSSSPAALGASAVPPMGGRGPCLPSKPLPRKRDSPTLPKPNNGSSSPPPPPPPPPPFPLPESQHPHLKENGTINPTFKPPPIPSPSTQTPKPIAEVPQPQTKKSPKPLCPELLPLRPLKLVYGDDIRLAQMPAKCKLVDLREIVKKRFPSSKHVLIKFKDSEGDLVTITNTVELRLAEQVLTDGGLPSKVEDNQANNNAKAAVLLQPLRLYVVEVVSEQEPSIDEEEDLDEVVVNDEDEKSVDENAAKKALEKSEDSLDGAAGKKQGSSDEGGVDSKEKTAEEEAQADGKVVEIDEWLLDFAHLFRSYLGIDPDGHVDLHEIGMEKCSEALEQMVTGEKAQELFEAAASKFQEVAALAFFNWGNVHMCSARKRFPMDGKKDIETSSPGYLQTAFDWAQSQYALAEKRYEEALRVKPDFYEGHLALGQEKFEIAKLRWSFALTSAGDNLGTWDSSGTLELFESAEDRMKIAAEMLETVEEQRTREAKPAVAGGGEKKDCAKGEKCVHGHVHDSGDGDSVEQVEAMRSQISLFWGNILFERSQMEYKLKSDSWEQHLEGALQKFELAGASPFDISMVLKNHFFNTSVDADKASPKLGSILKYMTEFGDKILATADVEGGGVTVPSQNGNNCS